MNPPVLEETVRTRARCDMIDITDRIASLVSARKTDGGYVIVYVPHTTAGITINENADPDVKHDMLHKLSELVPKKESYYRHGEGNSDSHVKTAMVGNSVTVLIEAGRLLLGTWQGIYFCEFDGPRQRRMLVKIVAT